MAARLCSVPFCNKVIPDGTRYLAGCARCKVREQQHKPWGRKKKRLSFYGTAKWQKLRAVKLATDPVCEECKDTLAVEVDHTVPANETNPELWYDWNNLKSMCQPCHAKKTAAESARVRRNYGN